jgi:hypothetical protein
MIAAMIERGWLSCGIEAEYGLEELRDRLVADRGAGLRA